LSVRLSNRTLSVAAAHAALEGPGVGGAVVFVGRVRPDTVGRRRVVALDYEVDRPVALRELRSIERDVVRRFGAQRSVLWHRVGTVGVGEVAVVTGAACAHRDEAFRAARELIERVKASVPIWKVVQGRPVRRPRRRPARRAGRSTG
jgi:molybdopterin synthase catalytic subunit